MHITYNGIKNIGNKYFIDFKNDKNKSISIPIDKNLAKHFELYFAKLLPAVSNSSVERGNEEEPI